jgi:uncharacterized protein YcbX
MAAMVVGTICELWRYPVKSMGGERLARARVSERGVDGDRIYAVRDGVTGKIASAKHPRLWEVLLQCAARYSDSGGAVAITLPSDQQVTGGQDDVEAALCTLTGHVVHLVHVVPERAEIERF